MRNIITFSIICGIIICAAIIGKFRSGTPDANSSANTAEKNVPHIGRIQVLNGCGIDGIAWKTADFLRKNGFDVKNDGIGNAPTFNYAHTLVVSRIKDMSIARQIGKALSVKQDKVILLRDGKDDFDVTIFLGEDSEGLFK